MRCAMGVRERQARGARRRIWLPGVIAAAAISLAGCGTATGPPASNRNAAPATSASQMRSAASGTLCADAGAVDRLTVSRIDAIPANRSHFSFPAVVTVRDAAQARSVARQLCALQPQPRDVVACPADLGVTYQLEFATSRHSLPPVVIRAGGCEQVSGAGLPLWTMRTPAFWAVLGQAMGLAHPGHAAFSGTMMSS
jgi:hypothetical protein